MKIQRKELLYPVFIKATKLVDDMFWFYLFEDLAYGICPFGTFIDPDKQSLKCNFKGKQFNFIFKDKTPEEIVENLIQLLSNKLNICSKVEYLKKRIKFGKSLELSYENWKDIKKKNIKDILLENYVITLKKKYDLTPTQTKKLFSVINMGFMFKLITNSHVVYDSDKSIIIDIKGLDIQEMINNNVSLSLSDNYKLDKTGEPEKLSVKSMWSKFISE